MLSGLLPIGSVVLLTESTKRVMIIGLCQRSASNPDVIWDYCGVVFPEGFLSPETTLLFNGDQIERIYAIGYQDEEQLSFISKASEALAKIRGQMQ